VNVTASGVRLQLGHFIHHPFEAVLAEQLMFLSLEVLPQRVVFAGRDDLPQRREEDRVLTCRMGPVHADEELEDARQLRRGVRAAQALGRHKMQHLVRELPPLCVLRAQDAHQLHESSGPLEAREEVLLLQPLMVFLNEAADDPSPAHEDLGGCLLASSKPPETLLVDEQYPAQDAVLAHEILGGSDFLLLLLGAPLRRAPSGRGCASGQHPTCANPRGVHQQGPSRTASFSHELPPSSVPRAPIQLLSAHPQERPHPE
jgi:hypothetical protein